MEESVMLVVCLGHWLRGSTGHLSSTLDRTAVIGLDNCLLIPGLLLREEY